MSIASYLITLRIGRITEIERGPNLCCRGVYVMIWGPWQGGQAVRLGLPRFHLNPSKRYAVDRRHVVLGEAVAERASDYREGGRRNEGKAGVEDQARMRLPLARNVTGQGEL